jgi:5-methyltetrahydrofolate--homocysteine methyltransferase
LLRKIGEILKPKLAAKTTRPMKLGTVVLGTVRGDIHDIGKDIVGFMLEVNTASRSMTSVSISPRKPS